MTVDSDILVPSFASTERQSTLTVATFNLVATIVSGGVLSLPLAFEKCGIVVATLLMLLSAAITDRSLYLLCLSARLSGVSSYGEIGNKAFGVWMERGISLMLFVFLLFVLVAFMVLVRDIWAPIIGMVVKECNDDIVLLVMLILMSPFLLQRNLHALRFNCYVGFASVSLLCLALCHHGFLSPRPHLKLWPTNISDVLFAFPIITLSFLSHFNILPIQAALINPSRMRINHIIHSAVVSCFVLMYLFGLGGYLYAGDTTKGNILLNVANETTDYIFFIGRIGCGITIMLAIPMILLPCRQSILAVIDAIVGMSPIQEVTEQTPLYQSPIVMTVGRSSCIHIASTLAILVITYLGAVVTPGVAIVWSLCGSSMAFLIAFILPAACYLEIGKVDTTYRTFSFALLVFAVLGATACSVQTTLRLLKGSSQE